MIVSDNPSTSSDTNINLLSSERIDIMNKQWLNILENHTGGILPSIDECLFSHNQVANRTLLEFLCPIGSVVLVNTDENGPRFAEVIARCGTSMKVEIIDDDHDTSMWIDYTKIVTHPKTIELAKSTFELDEADVTKLCKHSYIAKHRKELSKKLWEVVEEGQWLELQCRQSPQIVYFAKVIKNHQGILLLQAGPYQTWTHVRSPHLHYLGWAKDQDPEKYQYEQYVKYSSLCKLENYEEIKNNYVPRIAFLNNFTPPHDLKIGSLVAVCSSDFQHFTYAHVRNLVNGHYFNVQVADLDMKETNFPSYPVAINDSQIFPVGYLESCGIQLEVPQSEILEHFDHKKFGWEQYKQLFSQKGELVASCGLTHHRETDQRITSMRYFELLCVKNNQCCFYAVELLKSEKSLLWVRQHFSDDVMIMSVGDTRIFPCGTSSKLQFPIKFEKEAEMFEEKYRNGARLSDTTPIFVKEGDEKKIFTPFYVYDEDIAPPMYINHKCVSGPYLDRKSIRELPFGIQSTDQKGVLRYIYRTLIQCSKNSLRQNLHNQFIKSYEDENSVPLMNVKYRRNLSEFPGFLKVPVCDKASRMVVFVKALLRSIDACPNLFNFEKPGKCSLDCNKKLRKFVDNMEDDEIEYLIKKESKKMENIQEENIDECNNVFQSENKKEENQVPSSSENRDLSALTASEGLITPNNKRQAQNDMDKSMEKRMKCSAAVSAPETSTPLREALKCDFQSVSPIIKHDGFGMAGLQKMVDEKKMENQQERFHVPSHPQMMPNFGPTSQLLQQHQQQMLQLQLQQQQQQQLLQQQQQQQLEHLQHQQQQQQQQIMQPQNPFIMSPFFPSPHISNVAPQMVDPQMIHYFMQMQKAQQNEQKREKEGISASPNVFPTPSPTLSSPASKIPKNKLGQASTSNGGGSGSTQCSPSTSSLYQSKEKVVLIEKPSVDIVKEWSVEQLSDYLRKNFLNLGSESIKVLKDKKVDGSTLMSLTKDQCVEVMGSIGHGLILFRFIDWVKKDG